MIEPTKHRNLGRLEPTDILLVDTVGNITVIEGVMPHLQGPALIACVFGQEVPMHWMNNEVLPRLCEGVTASLLPSFP